MAFNAISNTTQDRRQCISEIIHFRQNIFRSIVELTL